MARIPSKLLEIQKFLESKKIKCHENIEGEGRFGSLMDEGTLKKDLLEEFPNIVFDQPPRALGDLLFKDDENNLIQPINIKTSLGGTDDAFSKGGFVYALTTLRVDIEKEIPKRMSFQEMKDLIDKYRCDNPMKDYWYLCVDKKSCSVFVRGAKQINHWKVNPSNVLQINWKQEKSCDPILRTGEEAYNTLIEKGVKESVIRYQKTLPIEWRI